jgi:hypothetical protein
VAVFASLETYTELKVNIGSSSMMVYVYVSQDRPVI